MFQVIFREWERKRVKKACFDRSEMREEEEEIRKKRLATLSREYTWSKLKRQVLGTEAEYVEHKFWSQGFGFLEVEKEREKMIQIATFNVQH